MKEYRRETEDDVQILPGLSEKEIVQVVDGGDPLGRQFLHYRNQLVHYFVLLVFRKEVGHLKTSPVL
jgi:hypothetical protein